MKASFPAVCLLSTSILFLAADGLAQTGSEEAKAQEVTQEAQELIEALQEYGAERRDEAIGSTKDALADLDKRLEDLQTRVDNDWEQLEDAARQNTRAALRELQTQRVALAEWYGRWQESSSSAWEDMKKGFSQAYRALYDSWEQAKQEYGSLEPVQQ